MYSYEFYRIRQEEILQEAEKQRLISQVNRKPSRRKISLAPTLVWLGSKLYRWGYILQERFGASAKSRVTN
jgi:hypothetical protein